MPDPITWSQTWIENWATGLVAWLPIGYAFAAGMISTINPCGFAMLPAYLSMYVGTDESGTIEASAASRVARAVYIGILVTAGFVVLFGGMGITIAAGGQFLFQAMPWAGLLAGVALVASGILLLSGRHLHAAVMARLAARLGDPRRRGPGAFFLFGIAYAVASLACTLPVFLVVVGSSISARGLAAGAYQFVSYALGMGLVLVTVTLGMALFKGTTMRSGRALLPHVERASAVLILLMGTYLVYYWLIKGGLLGRLT